MSKILLVNTRPTRHYTALSLDERLSRYFSALEKQGDKLGDMRTEPNNGLLIIGGCLKSAGHQVDYLDLSAMEYHAFNRFGSFYTMEQMVKTVVARSIDCDFIFFSTIIVGVDDCLKLVDSVKYHCPDRTIVLGGSFPSVDPEYCLKNCDGIDALVIGEGEKLSEKIVQAYESKDFQALRLESGLIFRERKNSPYVKRSGYNLINLVELKERVIPDWSLVNPTLSRHSYRVMTSRGCGFRCTFCVPSHLNRHILRKIDKRIVLKAIHRLKEKYNAKDYIIGDLTFLYDEKHSREVLDLIVRHKIGLPFWCQTHLSRIKEANLDLLKRAGCAQIAVGVESIDPSILRNINKGISTHEIIQKLTMIKRFGIEVQTYFIVGLPGDSVEKINLNRRFVEYCIENKLIDRTHIGIYVPYPGIKGNKGIENIEDDYSLYTQGVFKDIPARPVYRTNRLSRGELEEAYNEFLGSTGRVFQKIESGYEKTAATRG